MKRYRSRKRVRRGRKARGRKIRRLKSSKKRSVVRSQRTVLYKTPGFAWPEVLYCRVSETIPFDLTTVSGKINQDYDVGNPVYGHTHDGYHNRSPFINDLQKYYAFYRVMKSRMTVKGINLATNGPCMLEMYNNRTSSLSGTISDFQSTGLHGQGWRVRKRLVLNNGAAGNGRVYSLSLTTSNSRLWGRTKSAILSDNSFRGTFGAVGTTSGAGATALNYCHLIITNVPDDDVTTVNRLTGMVYFTYYLRCEQKLILPDQEIAV